MTWIWIHPPHLIVHCRMRSLPPHYPSLRIVAQDLQCGAEDDRGASSGVRRGGHKQKGRCPVARGLLSGGARLVATGVVLYHRSQGQQAEAAARLSPGPSTTADVMGQQGARLGAVQGRSSVAGPDSRPPRKGDQSGRSDTGYADPAPSALQTSPPPPVGI